MTQQTPAQILTAIATDITTNGAGGITGAELAAILNNLVDSTLFMGKRAIPLLPGALMDPATLAPEYVKVSVSGKQLPAWAFATGADEELYFALRMPKSAAETTLTFQYTWSHPSTTTNFGVAFFLEAVALGNDDALNTAYGTAVGQVDTGGTTDDIYTSPESGTVTPGGTWAEGDIVIFRFYRDVSDAGDTLAVDARIHQLDIFPNLVAQTDE